MDGVCTNITSTEMYCFVCVYKMCICVIYKITFIQLIQVSSYSASRYYNGIAIYSQVQKLIKCVYTHVTIMCVQ